MPPRCAACPANMYADHSLRLAQEIVTKNFFLRLLRQKGKGGGKLRMIQNGGLAAGGKKIFFKLLRLGVLFTQFLLLCPTTDNLRFCQTERQTFFNAAHFRRNGRKKSSKPFSDLLLVCAAMTAAGIQLYLLISVRQIGIHRSCTSFPLICSISISNI